MTNRERNNFEKNLFRKKFASNLEIIVRFNRHMSSICVLRLPQSFRRFKKKNFSSHFSKFQCDVLSPIFFVFPFPVLFYLFIYLFWCFEMNVKVAFLLIYGTNVLFCFNFYRNTLYLVKLFDICRICSFLTVAWI